MTRHDKWKRIVGVMQAEALKHGLHYRATPLDYLTDTCLCSVVSPWARLYLTLHPDGDLRIRYRRDGARINAVTDVKDGVRLAFTKATFARPFAG